MERQSDRRLRYIRQWIPLAEQKRGLRADAAGGDHVAGEWSLGRNHAGKLLGGDRGGPEVARARVINHEPVREDGGKVSVAHGLRQRCNNRWTGLPGVVFLEIRHEEQPVPSVEQL